MSTLKRPALIVAAVVAMFAVAACGSDAKDEGVPVPKGFDLPDGVTLTKGGTVLTEDDSASVVYQVGNAAASAITVTVTEVRKGDIKDFRFFSLDEESKQSTPFYVKVTVKNEGPAGLGGAALPIYSHDSANTIRQANELVGTFKPCPSPALPKTFLPGASADLCLVYLVPKGKALQSVDLQTGSAKDVITWTP
ncbi:hypothetical protein J2X11_002294 [Aeromicrobium panaciterrae]|uniref:DUF4352 domain-containing protein n=1 Tax=Aeromicrobium panaciterrae TaxID=363861 RepID=A0ABU1UQM3_9ACTN|nr:hypothetical protein [Aeromicrobium panaciterrae]MDR7087455.1 hypothetical protein [Aeromicrobium panaciterrae]